MKIRSSLALTAAAVLLPVVLAALVALDKVHEGERQTALRGLRETVRATSLLVDREIQGSMWALRALGNSEHLETGNYAAFYDQAVALNRGKDVWTLLLDQTGTQVLNTIVPFGTPPPPAAAAKRVARVIATPEPMVSDVLSGPVTRRLLTVVDVPARAAGGSRFVVSQAFTVDHWKKTVLQLPSQPQWVVAVLDRTGRFIARSHGDDALLGSLARPELVAAAAASKEGLIRHPTLEGLDSYDAFVHSALTGWTIAVAAPVGTIEASGRQTTLWLVAGLATAVVAAVMAAMFFGGRFIEAIEAASSAARDLGQGERPRTRPTTIDEFKTLNAALSDAGLLLESGRRSRDAAAEERERWLESQTAAREAAEAANQAKDKFLAMLGHELRNPLAAISGAASLLSLGHADEESTEQCLQIIIRQNRHLVHIVDDLLEVSRLMAGKISLHKEPFDLAACVRSCIEAVRASETAQGYTLVVETDDLWIEGDAVRIEQVVNNLVSNAMKFSSSGSSIHVSARSAGGRAVIEVRDEGLGMPAHLLPRVFDPFVQGPSIPSRVQSGMGIGLALVKQLVELHDGKVKAHSEGPGLGSVFTVSLPTIKAPRPAVSVAPSPSCLCRLLLVEDNADTRTTMAQLLRLDGFVVFEAASGAEALSLVEDSQIDVGIIDIGLPDMDGYRVAALLRGRGATRRMGLIALTGYGQGEAKARAAAAGFDEHLTKPVDQQVLKESIQRLLQHDPAPHAHAGEAWRRPARVDEPSW
jgi:signal transduction histidine kinase/CheY-like chemotaxis protein